MANTSYKSKRERFAEATKRVLPDILVMALVVAAPVLFIKFTGSSKDPSKLIPGMSVTKVDAKLTPPNDLSDASLQALRKDPNKLHKIFNFNIDAKWIHDTWPRVEVIPELQYRYFEISLVTGTKDSDLTGVLKYYFDHRGTLQHIHFSGYTGDKAPLERLLQQQYSFLLMQTNNPNIYRWEAPSASDQNSILKIRTAPVLYQGEQHDRYRVDLILHRPEM